MKYLKVNTDQYVEIDENDNVRMVSIKQLEQQIEDAEARLKEIPVQPDDKELLEWARANHPQMMDYSVARANYERIISENKAILEEI